MNDKDFGFPPRIDFEENAKPKYRSKLTFGRFFIFLLALGACGFGAYLASLDPKVWQNLQQQLFGKNVNNPEFRAVQRMFILRDAGQLDGAIREADKLIAKRPRNTQYRHFRAECLTIDRNYSEAAKELSKIIEITPSDHTALNNRAYFNAILRKDLAQAWVDIEKAIRIEGDNPVYIDTRGYLRYLLRQPKQALDDMNISLSREMNRTSREGIGEIYFHRALVYKQLGETELAKADFDKSRDLGFHSEETPMPLTEAEAKTVLEKAAVLSGAKPARSSGKS